MRARPDGDAARALDAPIVRRSPARHARRRLASTSSRRATSDPPIVLSHGVTISMRTWFHQLEELPEGRLPHDRVRPPRSRAVGGRRGGALAREPRATTCKTVVEGLDLHDAVLVGHSMGGVAVQAFVTRFPEIAAERVAGIVLLSTLAYTPFGSRSTRTKAAHREAHEAHARHRSGCGTSPNLGLPRGAARLRQATRIRATSSSCGR